MIIATVFWFHPLVWWIGDRLVTERERACDEPSKREAGHHWDSNEDRASIEGYSLRDLIVYAYGLKSNSQALGEGAPYSCSANQSKNESAGDTERHSPQSHNGNDAASALGVIQAQDSDWQMADTASLPSFEVASITNPS